MYSYIYVEDDPSRLKFDTIMRTNNGPGISAVNLVTSVFDHRDLAVKKRQEVLKGNVDKWTFK